MSKLLVHAHTALATAAGRLRRREDGQTMAEFGLVLTVIVLTVMTGMTMLSTRVHGTVEAVAGMLP